MDNLPLILFACTERAIEVITLLGFLFVALFAMALLVGTSVLDCQYLLIRGMPIHTALEHGILKHVSMCQ